ncbi:hypothetical protein RD792_015896 [Penstemon davidsonii]|uniref:Dirigent protein n=1 Tax=Penstemon davidsonii TaxID=160366 RepID=A0ABR0CJQ0_9LAMI|nr:hypothetical protein RD792_015896 [Penstemon davidsonii]
MAKVSATFVLCLAIIISMPWAYTINADQEAWFQNISNRKEKVIKLHFYLEDSLGGQNETIWEVARADISSTSPTSFGKVFVFDDPFTAEPDPKSMKLGRAQGIIASADLRHPAIAVYFNFYFTAGKYKGSSLSIMGRNEILGKNRELPVVGGTGAFRMARGFSISNTNSYDPVAKYGTIVEHTVYVSTYV